MNRLAASALTVKIQAVWPDRPWSQARIEQWTEVLEQLDERAADIALVSVRSTHEKCPAISEFLNIARPQNAHRRDSHSLSCICGGSGWMSVPQTNGIDTWEAWARCPNGPHTSFVEPDKEYDPVAGAAAFETFDALAATAETRADLANACFAAAAAYSNAERKTLL